MKLSEAIRMYSLDAPCALGGALQSIGTPAKNQTDYSPVKVAWPWVKEPEFSCPIAKGCSPRTPLQMIWHLNDTHRWTRQQIADWVETVEPSEPAQEPNLRVGLYEDDSLENKPGMEGSQGRK